MQAGKARSLKTKSEIKHSVDNLKGLGLRCGLTGSKQCQWAKIKQYTAKAPGRAANSVEVHVGAANFRVM
jgi:hypothetical protein